MFDILRAGSNDETILQINGYLCIIKITVDKAFYLDWLVFMYEYLENNFPGVSINKNGSLVKVEFLMILWKLHFMKPTSTWTLILED